MGSWVVARDADGQVSCFMHEFELTAKAAEATFGIARLSDQVTSSLEKHPYERFTFVHAIAPREMTFGWTIEPQVVAPRLGARIAQVRVTERHRLAGQQKVTGVSLRHSFKIGLAIARAGLRSRRREETAAALAPSTSV